MSPPATQNAPIIEFNENTPFAGRDYQFKDDENHDTWYTATRRDLDEHHNLMAKGLMSLMSTQDKIWEALQVNLDMSRMVLKNVIGQSEMMAPDGNLIKGLIQVQNNVSSCVQESHEALST